MTSEPMKMFRGQSKAVWKEQFRTAGWPEEAADAMARWLTAGKNQPPPDFAEVARLAADMA
jgi:hypothetical protein